MNDPTLLQELERARALATLEVDEVTLAKVERLKLAKESHPGPLSSNPIGEGGAITIAKQKKINYKKLGAEQR